MRRARAHAPLPRVRRRSAAAAGRAQPSAREFGRADPGRPPRPREAAVARRADGPDVRPPRCARQQRVVVLSDADRRHHACRLGRPDRHQPAARRCSSRRPRRRRSRKAQGAIVNITDIHAERPLKNYVVYSIAKAGLVGLTRSLARELAPEVRVNAVAPGPILWPDDESFDELSRQRIISHTPLKREGTPDDIARAVHFLLADAPYVTGETHQRRRRAARRHLAMQGVRESAADQRPLHR